MTIEQTIHHFPLMDWLNSSFAIANFLLLLIFHLPGIGIPRCIHGGKGAIGIINSQFSDDFLVKDSTWNFDFGLLDWVLGGLSLWSVWMDGFRGPIGLDSLEDAFDDSERILLLMHSIIISCNPSQYVWDWWMMEEFKVSITINVF
jgi:hypothetical protein